MKGLLLYAAVCLALTACQRAPSDPVQSVKEVMLEITEMKLTRHTHFSFRETKGGYQYLRVGTGLSCPAGARYRVGDRVKLRVTTYMGKQGPYSVLPMLEAMRLCR
jgi:outer membrane biogenesis lipoprotein LolB